MTIRNNALPQRVPVIFSYGFRPFFLGASVWAAISMMFWLGMLSGRLSLPVRFDPVSWHAHAFIFGYLSAVLAGFLLTAVPNWTGRPVMRGAPLVGLFALWVLARAASLMSDLMPPVLFGALDCAMPGVLAVILLREIVASGNWRNLMVFALLLAFTLGNVLFHFHAPGYAAGGLGLRIMLGAAVMLVALIGGRIVPAFTRNWLKAHGAHDLPAEPMGRIDKASLLVLAGALVSWIWSPETQATALALIATGLLHVVRLVRWKGWLAHREPAIWVMHIGYLFVPLGALGIGFSTTSGAQHLWMAGAIGTMTLAVMTRASLGHMGRAVEAAAGTRVIYAAIIGAVMLRLLADTGRSWDQVALTLSGLLWIGAFGGFVVVYGHMLMLQEQSP